MSLHPLAGKPAPANMLKNIPRLVAEYFAVRPDPKDVLQRVSFGTSGHRGSAESGTFNEEHILAVSQAVCDYRKFRGFEGPLFLGKDTHALSEPAFVTALEVMTANGVEVVVDADLGFTPTPVISHAVLTFNRQNPGLRADGVVLTPSHNPPEDGGFKYNPPHGGPAEAEVTRWIQDRANRLLEAGNREVIRLSYRKALDRVLRADYVRSYVSDLENVVRLNRIREEGVRIGVDPMGGAGTAYWDPIADRYRLDITVVNRVVDPSFRFMTLDWDGKIRMDCSSPYAMAGLIGLKDHFQVACGNDTDNDRHGIVTPAGGLLNPNHFLAVSVWYLFLHRPHWSPEAAVGKTLVSSSILDRVAERLGRRLYEVPVGFKWFVSGLLEGRLGFGGEESAGASFLRMDGTAWTTDKDGFIMDLLAAEIIAETGRDPAEIYRELTAELGEPVYRRVDRPANPLQKQLLAQLRPEDISATELAGEPILAKLTRAPGNQAEIGGIKVVAANGWFAARPSGTEDVYKLYLESFLGVEHLQQIQRQAEELIQRVFEGAKS
ncbi:MAG TPA: phosphoglucomutase (alpha-D-glucose-1,6-bisphosphate-dependent) [Acidobacteriota bacterium]|jgi:phosphoglucomutase|nr:phosphoglucomutase (alpha-D-glucose-1,6-bisphosphate-dependent) [Acidobacteriota bacterium]HRV07085.1 phosphoglucomutase (alpha-D-glucose-1,6-bisphosphate-dependent) [Acidobacteriota bacterium]